jgi:hypothetical protein
MSETIFQVTDLAQRRVEFVEAARGGGARLRDKDGTSLVMLPESRLLLLEELARWNGAHLRLEELIERDSAPSISDLGELAWLRVFQAEDLAEFLRELHEALVASHADGSTAALDDCLHAWRVTARQLEDPLRRSILVGDVTDEDLVEAGRPGGE